ncbi:pentapeptide repeat-containing protein [Nostoc sp. UCD120]|uniref:pentapeptide repeat-containing protein n=1 Tax=Nostoc sp. UCD120 TaxID=2681312 RepID=UPI0021AB2CAC|nr:pentapeptide repeat-containing protein [Nostoc sp. UCD120]
MANEEHLAILRQGVGVWNRWMNEKIPIGIDITEAFLREIDLGFPDLSGADLQEINLANYDFRGTNFSRADFQRVNLIKANLRYANFEQANLSDANLIGASLEQTNFTESELQNADFSMASIRFSTFRRANLSGARFLRAFLSGIDFIEAILDEADFMDANLGASNFTNASLLRADLTATQALSCRFTGAKLTGVCIQDWNINAGTRLDQVDCKYVYIRGSQYGEKERFPLFGNFEPGEFTKLLQKSVETVDLIFRNGIDWDAFAYSFKKLEVENQGAQLDVQSIEKKGDGILVVRVTVAADADKAKIHNEFMQGYEFAVKALEAQYQARLEDKDKVINQLFSSINQLNR